MFDPSLAPYSEGPKNAKIAIIGEAAGVYELRAQRPFVGKAGILLDSCLRRAGIPRSSCYIDNVFQVHPSENDVTSWIHTNRAGDVITDSFWFDSQEALRARLRETDVNVIVAMGNVPLYTLTGEWGITKKRGSLYWSDALERKVVACYHPSFALRTPTMDHLITLDLQRARSHSLDREHNPVKREFNLNPTLGEIQRFLNDATSYPIVAFDIEVSREEVSHISFAVAPNNAICIPLITDTGRDIWNPIDEAIIWQEIARLLENSAIEKLGQNVSFDATFLFRRYGIRSSPMHDTMIAQSILQPDYKKGLDFITSIYCDGEPYYKDDGKKWLKNPFGDDMTFRQYNAMDSAVLMEAWPIMVKDLRRTGNWPAYEKQVRLVEPLVFIGEHGIRMNTEGLNAAAEENQARIDSTYQELWKICGYEINIASPKQVQEYFYIRKGLRPYTKQGRMTVDVKALQRIAAKGYEEAKLMLSLRHMEKMQGTYFKVRMDEDNRLRCSWNPAGTKQARISSSKTIFGTGANLQNQPPETQVFMLADVGYITCSLDLSQAENRVVAVVFNDHRMAEAFANGLDIHKLTASLIFGVPIDEVTPEQRQWGKKANHGLNYDLGVDSFAVEYQITRSEASAIVGKYHQIYPGVREGHRVIKAQLGKDRTLINCFGRKRTFLGMWGDSLFKEAYSYIPQSTIGMKTNEHGVCYVYYEKDPLFQPVQLLNTVHDSIKFQLPTILNPAEMLHVIRKTQASMSTPLKWKDREFEIPTDVKVGMTLGEDDMTDWKAPFFTTAPDDILEGKLEELSKCA